MASPAVAVAIATYGLAAEHVKSSVGDFQAGKPRLIIYKKSRAHLLLGICTPEGMSAV